MVLHWGIASAGKISHDFVAALHTLPRENHEVIAVAARSHKSALNFAKIHGIPKAFEGYEALASEEKIDVVYVSVINSKHLEVAKLMLDQGKHILCEKPLTLNAKQTKELLDYAKKKNCFLMDAVWSRCFPVYKELRNQIDSGNIGEILYVSVAFGFPLDHVERVNVKEFGGSVTLDLGVYILQFQQYVFRGLKPINVVSTGHLNKYNTDETVGAVITYPNGKTAVVSASSRLMLPNEAIVAGTKGTIKIPLFWCPTTLITPKETFEYELPPSTFKFNYRNSAGLSYEAEETRRCIESGLVESPQITHGESLELAELMDILRKSVGNVFEED